MTIILSANANFDEKFYFSDILANIYYNYFNRKIKWFQSLLFFRQNIPHIYFYSNFINPVFTNLEINLIHSMRYEVIKKLCC
jgi:hypothetical protein